MVGEEGQEEQQDLSGTIPAAEAAAPLTDTRNSRLAMYASCVARSMLMCVLCVVCVCVCVLCVVL